MEERRREPHRLRRRLEAAGQAEIGRLHAADHEGHGQRAEGDSQLEHTVGEHRPRQASDITRRRRRAEGEPAHVRREHRDHRQLRRPEQERELPRPGGLVEQGREAGDEEADEQEEETKVHGFRLLEPVVRPVVAA